MLLVYKPASDKDMDDSFSRAVVEALRASQIPVRSIRLDIINPGSVQIRFQHLYDLGIEKIGISDTIRPKLENPIHVQISGLKGYIIWQGWFDSIPAAVEDIAPYLSSRKKEVWNGDWVELRWRRREGEEIIDTA